MNSSWLTAVQIEEAARFVRQHTRHTPQIGLVLGSGLSPLAETIGDADRIPFHDIPHFPVSTVEGHSGTLVIGWLEGQAVLALQGRVHFYEGYSMQQITLPIRVMQLLGLHTVILTNAAGGINANWRAGDLMLLTDHINFLGLAGHNPLLGPNEPAFGLRFPSMTKVYDPELRRRALEVAARLDLPLRQGVYANVSGPMFETPADIRFLRAIGADAVGMSTVPEAIVARHGGLRVLAVSAIANMAIDSTETSSETTHEEVLEAGKTIVPRLSALLRGVLGDLPPAPGT